MKRKDYLVQLKKGVASFENEEGTKFQPNKHYRCIELSENSDRQMLVFGHVFSEVMFNFLFEYTLDKVKDDFEAIGLLVDGKPISKTKFNQLSDVHKYGRGQSMLNVVYFNGENRLTYGFYPRYKGDSKAISLKTAYSMYIDLLNGESNDFECGNIQFGNCGIPISYGDLRIS